MHKKHLALHTGIILFILALAIISEYSGMDIMWAGEFYDSLHHQWPYKNTFITGFLLHDMGKDFVTLLFIMNFFMLLASFISPAIAPYRKVLAYVLLAYASGPVIVAIIKSTTHIYTPWKLQLFDSYRPYVRFFDHAPGNLPYGHAFPGGHSSGGFGFIALYIYALSNNHRYRHYALAFPLLVGGIFAVDQEVRGAHFLSHDLVSLAICWMAGVFWFLVFYGVQPAGETAAGKFTPVKQAHFPLRPE